MCTLLKFCFKIPSTSIEPRFTGSHSVDMQGTRHRATQFIFTALLSELSHCWTRPYGYMILLNILWLTTMFTVAQLVPVLIQINPIHVLLSCWFKIHSGIFLPSMSWFSKWFPSVPPKMQCVCLFCAIICHIPSTSEMLWFVHTNNIWWGL